MVPGPVVPHLEVPSGSGNLWPCVPNPGSYNFVLVLKHYIYLSLFDYLPDCSGCHSGPGHLVTVIMTIFFILTLFSKRNNKGTNNNNNTNTRKPYSVVPYIKSMGESCKNICRKHGVEVYFKVGSTIKDLLVHPKDKDTILQKSGVIYRYRCGRVGCEDEYIGESDRKREHMRAPSPIIDHHNITGHEVSLDNFSIVGREDHSIARTIKEAIVPSLNRNIGKFQLPHIWDKVLVKSPELKLK